MLKWSSSHQWNTTGPHCWWRQRQTWVNIVPVLEQAQTPPPDIHTYKHSVKQHCKHHRSLCQHYSFNTNPNCRIWFLFHQHSVNTKCLRSTLNFHSCIDYWLAIVVLPTYQGSFKRTDRCLARHVQDSQRANDIKFGCLKEYRNSLQRMNKWFILFSILI